MCSRTKRNSYPHRAGYKRYFCAVYHELSTGEHCHLEKQHILVWSRVVLLSAPVQTSHTLLFQIRKTLHEVNKNNPVEVRIVHLKGITFNKYILLGLLPHQHYQQYTCRDPLECPFFTTRQFFLVHQSLFFRISTLHSLCPQSNLSKSPEH